MRLNMKFDQMNTQKKTMYLKQYRHIQPSEQHKRNWKTKRKSNRISMRKRKRKKKRKMRVN